MMGTADTVAGAPAASGTTYVNSHADEPRCTGCGRNHTPINQYGFCLPCWLRKEA